MQDDDLDIDGFEGAEADRQLPARVGDGGLPALQRAPKDLSGKDLLKFYLAQVRKYPLLSAEEEKEVARRYVETGDRQAAERLITASLRLVIKIAFQYHRRWASVLDLIQEGNVGLVEALSRYDPSREVRFSSYAQFWIRAMILRFLLDNFRMVRLGSTRAGRKLFFRLQKERDQLMREGIVPSTRLLADRLDVSETDVHDVDQHMRAPALSFHAPTGDEDGRPLAETVPEDVPHNPEWSAARAQYHDVVRERLDAFAAAHITDDRSKQIWERRIRAADPASLSSLGKDFGVSKERVRQLEARIIGKLKTFLGDEFVGLQDNDDVSPR